MQAGVGFAAHGVSSSQPRIDIFHCKRKMYNLPNAEKIYNIYDFDWPCRSRRFPAVGKTEIVCFGCSFDVFPV